MRWMGRQAEMEKRHRRAAEGLSLKNHSSINQFFPLPPQSLPLDGPTHLSHLVFTHLSHLVFYLLNHSFPKMPYHTGVNKVIGH